MKILSIGNFGYGWDGSICDEEHIAQALEALGHEVVRIQRENIINYIDSTMGQNDFILIAQWDGYSEDDLWRAKEFSKCPIVYWAFDYQADGQEWHERLVREADLYLSKRIADSKYPNWQWLCQDFAPSFLDKFPGDVDEDIDVLFTGTYLPWADERNWTLKAIDDSYNLVIYSLNPAEWISAGFKNVNGPAMDDQLPRLIARAKINVSIDHTPEAGYWSDRNAQIMCCGGLVLFKHVPCSTQVFGGYIDYFHDTQSCLERIEYYLENPDKRAIKEQHGYKYAQGHLTVNNRAKDLLTIVRAYL